jgi:hypothetical protein
VAVRGRSAIGSAEQEAEGPAAERSTVLWLAYDLWRFAIGPDGNFWAPAENARAQKELLTAALMAWPSIEVRVLDHAALGMRPERFGVDSRSPAEDWARRHHAPLSDEVASALRATIADGMVMSFETPPALSACLDELAGVHLDTIVHPWRFLPDLCFGVTTRHPDLARALELCAVRPAEAAAHARAWAAMNRASHVPSPTLGRAALIALQMSRDSAVLTQGRFISIRDHAPDIEAIASEHDVLLVTPHPYEAPSQADLAFLLGIPNMRLTRANSYALLARDDVARLIAISSSLVHEAKAFGVEATALEPGASSGFPMNPPRHAVTFSDFSGPLGAALAQAAGVATDPAAAPLRWPVDLNWRRACRARWSRQAPEDAPSDPRPAAIAEGRLTAADLSASGALICGWHQPEDWGVWADGPVGVLSFKSPDAERPDGAGTTRPASALRMHLYVRGSLPEAQTLTICSDGRTVGTFTLQGAESGPQWVDVPVASPGVPGWAQFSLSLDRVREPAPDERLDRRRLGLGLMGVWFEEIAGDP